jgi:hypothetical protein
MAIDQSYLDDENDDDEDTQPYESVSDRKPLINVSPRDAVKQAIMSKMVGKNVDTSNVDDDSSDDEISSDPLMKDYEGTQADVEKMRKAKLESDYMNNLGAAATQIARGADKPIENNALYERMAKQGDQLLQGTEQDKERRAKVMSAIEQRKSREQVAADNRDSREFMSEQNRLGRLDQYKMHAQDIAARNKDKFDAKTEAQVNKWTSQMKDDLDPNKARGGNLASNQKRVDNAQRIEALLSQVHNNPDPRQMEELAISSQALLSSSGTPAAEQVKALIPHTAMSSANAFREWLTNNPTGTGQQEFVKRMAETVEREKDLANQQVQKAQRQRLSAYGRFKDADPETYNAILNSYGLGEGEEKEEKKKSESTSSGPTQNKPQGNGRAGQLVKVRGKMYRVGADGDSLEEVM